MTTRNEALCDEIRKRLDEFEAMVEDEDGREGYHTPTEMERYYIDSFVARCGCKSYLARDGEGQ